MATTLDFRASLCISLPFYYLSPPLKVSYPEPRRISTHVGAQFETIYFTVNEIYGELSVSLALLNSSKGQNTCGRVEPAWGCRVGSRVMICLVPRSKLIVREMELSPGPRGSESPVIDPPQVRVKLIS